MRGSLAALILCMGLGCGGLKPPHPKPPAAKPPPQWVRAAAVQIGPMRAPALSWAAAQTLVLAEPAQVVVVDVEHKLVLRQQALDHLPDGSPTWLLDAKGRWLLLYGTQALTLWDVLSWSAVASVPCLELRCERASLLGAEHPIIELHWPSLPSRPREWAALDVQTSQLRWRVGRAEVYASALDPQGALLVALQDEIVSLGASAHEPLSWSAQARRLFISDDELAWLEGPSVVRVCSRHDTTRCAALKASAEILDMRWAHGELWIMMTTGLAKWVKPRGSADASGWMLSQEYALSWAAQAAWRDAQLKDELLFVDDQRGALRVLSLAEPTLELAPLPLTANRGFAIEDKTRVWIVEEAGLALYQRTK